MERNRNIDFDSDVEVDSLKDAVWRLTTRVYLLEDFIAEKFGEVLGPSGFSKPTSPVPGSSAVQTTLQKNAESHAAARPRRGRKRRKPEHTVSSEAVRRSDKVQKTLEKTDIYYADPLSAGMESHGIQSTESDHLLVPKDEVVLREYEESDGNDDFLNERSDDDDANDSLEKDPDFTPSSDRKEHREKPDEKVHDCGRTSQAIREMPSIEVSQTSIIIKKQRLRRSPVYLHFTSVGNQRYQCNYCSAQCTIGKNGTTSTLLRHIKGSHTDVSLLPEDQYQRCVALDKDLL